MEAPVVRSIDLNLMMFPSMHNYCGAVNGWTSTPGYAAEGSYHPMKWPPGMVTGAHKLAGNVESYGFTVVQAGHKLGPLVYHVEMIPAPDNVLTPLHMVLSSWEVKFQNGEVTAAGSPMGSLLPVVMNAVICTDLVSLPLGFSPTSLINSVWHNVSATDIIAGWFEIAVTALFEYFASRAGGGATRTRSTSINFGQAMGIWREAVTPSGSGIGYGSAGTTLSSLAGAGVRYLGRQHFGYAGAITVGTGLGVGSFGSESVQYTSNRDGSWSVQRERVGPLGLYSSTTQYSQDAQGNSAVQHSERVGNFTGQAAARQERTADGGSRWVGQGTGSEGITGGSTETSPTVLDWL